MRKYLSIVILVTSLQLSAQDNKAKAELQIAGYINNDNILLRWVPSNYIEWQKGVKHGYSLYKRVVMKDGKAIGKLDSTLIGNFFPFPVEKWKKYADSSHFAIAAEALYGKEFEITTKSSNFFDLIDRAKEQDNRFSIGMLCSDQSFTVACMMGLGFIDSDVKNNEAYLYKVVLNEPDSQKKIRHFGYVVVDFEFGNYLPRPIGLNHQEIENAVTILVPYQPFKGIYNSFELQRSFDNRNFYTVKDKSYYSLSTTRDDPKFNIYSDTVASFFSTIYYRLRGRTSFDTYGPYSDTLIVQIMPSLKGEPWITELKEIGNSKMILSWKTRSYKKENVKGFMIYESKKYDGPYHEYISELTRIGICSVIIDAPENYGYFKVAAVDQFNRSYFSMPRLYQSVDSIPPSKPKGLTGSFDTTGVVNLKWNFGKEKDLLGYRMLYTANLSSEFSLVSKNFIYDSTLSSKFPLDMLSSDMYFKVVALDTRYNTSAASDPIKLVKPDKIQPSAPIILIEADSIGLARIKIAPSSSNDVTVHYLIFMPNSNTSEKIIVFKGTLNKDTTLTLTNLIGRGSLCCVAEDITGRKGVSNRIEINQQLDDAEKPFKVLAKPLLDEGVVDLIWDITNLSGSIMIYRNNDLNDFGLIATIESQTGKFHDRNVIINENYKYKLVAFNLLGKAVSKVITVRFK